MTGKTKHKIKCHHKKTPLGEVYEQIGESERRILQLEMKLQRRWILKKVFFFFFLSPEVWGGETYRQLLAEQKHLAWLESLKDKEDFRNYAVYDRVRRDSKRIAEGTIRAWNVVLEFLDQR